ncbi:hypothetical protein GCM10009119_05990 [Algoriphagus jejuensis]|uniref:Uncharacterized protein n=1 Tax=Algoriphagus jejuensis TaxID=419934 RepID=A0ABP3Y895_9BACT
MRNPRSISYEPNGIENNLEDFDDPQNIANPIKEIMLRKKGFNSAKKEI